MNTHSSQPLGALGSRRAFFRNLSFATALFTVPGAFAEELLRQTAWVEEGPFYPPKLPLDTDNDLLIVNDSITPAVGQVTHVSGRLLDGGGDPIRNATIELWNVDSHGIYLADQPNRSSYDSNFQGFGRFLTSSSGEYYFRTIKPIAYGGRKAPHLHFKVKMKGRQPWTTQLFIKGDPGNPQDGIWSRIGDEASRASVTVNFVPVKNSRIGELAAHFDMVLGMTPQG
ncbi:MAG TPA: protocatechuate 3,4-dioxygenase [Verrucomicrobiae bacterium]|nr:protocatechuate 3,4-dioxygenase [Verrucomicrobiae bacterium]